MIDREDERLTRLLGMVKAEADPVLWTRARARILEAEAGRRGVAWIDWLMRPAALAAATAALVLTTGVGLMTARNLSFDDEATTLTDALLDDEDTGDDPASVPDGAASDTGRSG